MLNYDEPSRIFPCILLTRNHMIFLVQFGINKYLLIFSKTTNCTRLTGSCNFASLFKNLLGLIYSKLHSKSCDYLYEQSNNLHVRSRHQHCITERTWIPMVFKQAMASLNLLARLSLVWVQSTFWHRDLRYDRRTPSVWNNGYFSLLTVNKHAVWKKPLHNLLWSATTATFSSKGHITLLILGFQSTETWRKSSLWVLRA